MFSCGLAEQLPLADQSVDMVFGSPPYCECRTYEDGLADGYTVSRKCESWIAWMLECTTEAIRVSKGPVLWVVAAPTRNRNYWPAPEGLLWEWYKQGGSSYRPCYWSRHGVPGSGGKDWFKANVEYVLCFKQPGALPWSNNIAMGHPPKYTPGGEMSYRLSSGERRNQWGGTNGTGGGGRRKNGKRKLAGRPSHRMHTKRRADGSMENQSYRPPVIANPGNLISIKVGGGHMGNPLAHENEAPFPQALAEWFIRSCCPPGGVVLDPFSGSGTTVAAARKYGRRGIGIDLRVNQCKLGRRRNAQMLLAGT